MRHSCYWLCLAWLCASLFWAWPDHGPASGQDKTTPPADGPSFWAFQLLKKPALPQLQEKRRIRTPIDAFVLARLQAKGLALSAEADRSTLLRRAFFDLIGLPPTLEEMSEFLDDSRPDAFERLIDRLLASPHFGERWGRHWLDAAGYADVTGTDNDAGIISLSDGKWRYRDYVIRSFNQDKPLADFLTEQIAGDELVDWRAADRFTAEIKEKLIATGFLRSSADDTDSPELNTPDIRHGVLQRTGEVLVNNLLGLTINCAKCHDHKFEPIAQQDYYRILAVLAPAFNPDAWVQPGKRALADISPAEKKKGDQHNAELDRKIAELKKRKEDKQIAGLESQRKKWGTLQTVYDVGPPTPTRLLKRGNHLKPGSEVPPGFVQVLCSSQSELLPQAAKPQGKTSGHRLALARWLTARDTRAHALLLRVQVNRIWQRLFGRGIVESTDNLGLSGARPTHPELLDWLASEYQANGGRLKPLLRLIVTSSVYRQASSSGNNEAARIDPDNLLLWRMRLRRLDSECVRDALLTVSGKLDRSAGGPPVPVEGGPDGRFVVKVQGLPTPTSQWRRSVYLLARRNYHPTILNVFDQPLLNSNCTARAPSAVVLQPLTMLNDDFVLEQAKHLAERVQRFERMPEQIKLAFRLVLSRAPSEKEMAASAAHLRRQLKNNLEANVPAGQAAAKALTHLCQMLLNTSEFLYVP